MKVFLSTFCTLLQSRTLLQLEYAEYANPLQYLCIFFAVLAIQTHLTRIVLHI